jgi:hypothetical protein
VLLNSANSLEGKNRGEWNDKKEEKFFEWNFEWAKEAKNLALVKAPVTLGDGIGIPD